MWSTNLQQSELDVNRLLPDLGSAQEGLYKKIGKMTGKKNSTQNDIYKPSAPISTGTIPRHSNKPPSANFEGLYEVQAPAPSAPPLDHMEEVAGYESLTFNQATVPPPGLVKDVWWEEDVLNPSTETVVHPHVTEKAARQALLKYAQHKCCFGVSAAKDMALTSFKYSTAFHYELQTFTEKRETSWKYVPYRGTDIDGSENGPAPLPWDIEAHPKKLFMNEERFLKVPHTQSVKPCHACKASGQITCVRCSGKGWVCCHLCSGRGSRTDERCLGCCFSSHGRGQADCSKCGSKGKIMCVTCEGNSQILCYIGLTVTWKVNTDEHIVEEMRIPEELVRVVSGQVEFEEEGSRVVPIQNCPDEAIKLASVQLIREHLVNNRSQRILAQRHQVRVVPISTITYKWKNYEGEFHICGFENKVYAPDYPQTCCYGCSVL